MRELQLHHLFDLATAELKDSHEELNQLYKWKFEHAITAAKATAAAGASLLVALTVALYQAKVVVSERLIIAGYAGATIIVGLGVLQYYRVAAIYRQYVAAHLLLSEVGKMRPFLQRYSAEVRDE